MPTEGDIIVHAGIGLGAFSLVGYGSWPMLNLGAEYIALDDLGGIGTLGVGAVVGMKRYNYDFVDDYSFARYFIAPRGVVHFDVGSDELDLYAGVQVSVSWWGDTTTDGSFIGPSSFNFNPGLVGGANYFISDNFGFFGELSYSLSTLNAGLTLKF